MRGRHQRAVSRTESFSRRVKENWDKRSSAEDAETRQVFWKPVRAGIFVEIKINQLSSSVRSDIGADGINAKAQRRKDSQTDVWRLRAFAAWR
jgi:hypothetical protein